MPRYAKDQDKNLRHMAYRVSSAIRPNNTLRMVYSSKITDRVKNSYEFKLLLKNL
jgi:hypothetical protein